MAHSALTRTIQMLKYDGVVAHQTDTVYGLACLPKEKLLKRLTFIKQRGNKQGFILLASNASQLTHFINCSNKELTTLNTKQTKPTTWLVSASDHVSKSLLGDTQKIAVRITSRLNIKEICEAVGPVVSTSANISNLETCQNVEQIRGMFGTNIDYIESSNTSGTGQASAIIDLQSGQVIRH
ncbi:MAG: L-threonylcarbamoyladenylate synthase [Pseudomonadota bacterium]